MTKYLIAAVILSLLGLSLYYSYPLSQVQAQEKTAEEILITPQPIETKSEFSIKLKSEVVSIPKPTEIRENPDKEVDDNTTLDEGAEGTITKLWKITYHLDQEYEREMVSEIRVEPKPKILETGTKIVWRTLETPDGQIRYWRHLQVWATHYDSHCLGCDEWTAIGLRQGKGVIAVDPTVIKLRSQVYVPGYGKAIAGDTGGAIKGKTIDLGFADARTAGWYAHFVDIYILN